MTTYRLCPIFLGGNEREGEWQEPGPFVEGRRRMMAEVCAI